MVQSSLVGWWPLTEWNGQANDLSGNGNDGTVNGATQGVWGRGGLTAYSFDGTDDNVDIPNNIGVFDGSQDFTVSFWLRGSSFTNGLSSERAVHFRGENPVRFESRSSGGFDFLIYDGASNLTVTASVTANEWAHFVGVFKSGDVMEFYKNSSLAGTTSVGSSIASAAVDSTFMSGGRGTNYYAGSIADVRVYNRALSPSEIQHLYQVGSAEVATPPAEGDSAAVSRWSFDDRSDTSTALDEWSSNDGTINGATYSGDAIRGLSMSFDDASSHEVSVSDDTSLPFDTSSFTVNLWVNADDFSADHTFFEKKQNSGDFVGFTLRYDNGNNTIGFSLDDGPDFTGVNVSNPFGTGAWYMLTAVRDEGDSEARLYINGTERGSSDISAIGDISNTNPLTIGSGEGEAFHDGNIDDVRVYSRPLSDYEVQQLYLWGTRGVDRRFEVMQQ